MSQVLLVNEVFETIQGEGSYTGTPSIFLRLQGCPVGCPWCDTKHTWDVLSSNKTSQNQILLKTKDDPRYFSAVPKQMFELFTQQKYQAKHIVITGGEPCMFDLLAFTEEAEQRGYSTQIETSGTFEVSCSDKTWVTVSPKINMKGNMPVLSQAMLRANEIKHPIAMQKHIDELDDLILQVQKQVPEYQAKLVYLQPISQQDRATKLAIKTCIARNWRLSVQLHKYIGIE